MASLEVEMGGTIDSPDSVSFILERPQDSQQPQTPRLSPINCAEINDLRHRATEAERQFAAESTKLAREQKKNRRLGIQINEYVTALSQSTQDVVQLNNQCHFLTTSNSVLFEEVRRLRLVVQTLEAVLQMFCPGDKVPHGTLGVDKSPQ